MSRLRGLLTFIGGLVLITLGLGMWRSPEVNWAGFLAVWSSLIDEVAESMSDPFAVLGVVVLISGLIIAFNGVKRLIRG